MPIQYPCESRSARTPLPDTMRPTSIDPDRIARWATAAALAALAVALHWSVRPWVGTKIPFLFFLPAIAIAAVRSGRRAGLFVAHGRATFGRSAAGD